MKRKVRITIPKRRLIYVALLSLGISLTSCEVVRCITTTAETLQEDNKTTIIQTKTIESYTGQKK